MRTLVLLGAAAALGLLTAAAIVLLVHIDYMVR